MNRAMTNDPDIPLGHSQKTGDVSGSTLVVKGHDHDGAFPFLQSLHTASDPLLIEAGKGSLSRLQSDPELLEQLRTPSGSSPHVDDRHAAGSEDKRRELLRIAQPIRSQRLN